MNLQEFAKICRSLQKSKICINLQEFTPTVPYSPHLLKMLVTGTNIHFHPLIWIINYLNNLLLFHNCSHGVVVRPPDSHPADQGSNPTLAHFFFFFSPCLVNFQTSKNLLLSQAIPNRVCFYNAYKAKF